MRRGVDPGGLPGSAIEAEWLLGLDGARLTVAWMLGAFLLTFVAARLVTRSIRRGRGPFRNTLVGGVHIHHQVYGIFLVLGAGVAEFTYRPGQPWSGVLAVLFGAGAALTLDEFALWLHVDDVYWTTEGRRSVDAVLVSVVIGTLLLLGANPFGEGADATSAALAATVAAHLTLSLVGIVKGRTALGVIGVLLPLVALVAAVRLARPGSPWARWWYPPGSRRYERARRRFPAGARGRWDPLIDLFALAPPDPAPAASDRRSVPADQPGGSP